MIKIRRKLIKKLALLSLTLIFLFGCISIFPEKVQRIDIENDMAEWINNQEHPISQDDELLLKYVRENYIFPMNNKPYNISAKSVQMYGWKHIRKLLSIFKRMKGGFFVELGANDGEFNSNTLYLEKVLGWTGLLIEGSPKLFKRLILKNRKAWHSNVAASTKPYPMKAPFYENSNSIGLGGLSYRFYFDVMESAQVQCIPLYTLLLSINQTTVDFLSLDVEGSELDILRTIPFHKLRINTLVVEVVHGTEGPEPLKELMDKNGFILIGVVEDGDYIFVNSNFLKELKYKLTPK